MFGKPLLHNVTRSRSGLLHFPHNSGANGLENCRLFQRPRCKRAPACRLPLYNEVKIGFVYFLAQAGGADYVYSRFVQPLLLDHEPRIDDTVLQTRAWLNSHVQNNIGWCASPLA